MTPFRDIIILGLGRALQVLAGLVTIKTATTVLSPGEVGSMNQLMSLAILGTSALLMPMTAYIGRGCLEWMDAGVLSQRLGSYLLIILAVALACGSVVWAIQTQLMVVSGMAPVWVGGLVVLFTVGFALHTMGASGLNLMGHRFLYILFMNLAAWGGLLLAIWWSKQEASPELWLLGIFFGFLLSSLSYALLDQYARVAVTMRSELTRVLPFDWRTISMFVGPQAIAFLFFWIQTQSYRFVLSWVADITTVGLFAAGYMICSVPMQTFESLFNEFYSPTMFRALRGQNMEGIARAWNDYAAAYIPAVILFGAFLIGNAAFLVKLLLGEQFQVIAPILIWPALTETFRAISSTLHQLGLAKVDMTVNILPFVIGAFVAPTLVYLLAPSEPLMGTALALLAAAGAALTAVVPISRRALPVVWPVRRILYAAALAVPLCLLGHAMGTGFGELSESKAMIALAISGLVMVLLQYVMAKEWLRQGHHEVRICEETRACP
ncbi:MAG: lipopolysaccharide biosynthesis protein [Nitrospira sp.]